MINNDKIVYLLFSIYKKRFDPTLVGVFNNKDEAIKTQKTLFIKKGYNTSFIIESPLSSTYEDYLNHWKQILFNKTRNAIKAK